MTYACPTWEKAADAFLLKLKRLKTRVLRTIGNIDRCTLVLEMHVAFKILYMYDYITKFCRTGTEVIVNHVNSNVRGAGQEEAMNRKYKRLKLSGRQAYDRSAD
jgi:hypothetical protein